MTTLHKLHLASFALLLFLTLAPLSTGFCHIEAEMPDPIAEIEYQMMLEFEPQDIETRYKLAMVYYRLQKDEKTEKELRKVLENNPDYFHALEGFGMLLLRQQRYQEAIKLLEKATLQPESESGTYYYLGQAEQAVSNLADAKKAFTTGLAKCQSEPPEKRAFTTEQFNNSLRSINLPH